MGDKQSKNSSISAGEGAAIGAGVGAAAGGLTLLLMGPVGWGIAAATVGSAAVNGATGGAALALNPDYEPGEYSAW